MMRALAGLALVATAAALVAPRSVLVVQNKGGGHGELGFHLAKQMRAKGLEVTILQDECKTTAAPFSSYPELEAAGVKVVYTKLTPDLDVASLVPPHDVVLDNNAKDAPTVAPLVNAAEAWGSSQFLYVSSAGMYKGVEDTKDAGVPVESQMGMIETDPVKGDNGCRMTELYLQSRGAPLTSFRPQYIYGSHSNKRLLDFVFDRVTRGLPVPLPYHGEQLAPLTNAADVASMMVAAVGNPAAVGQVYNCGSPRVVTYRGLVRLAAEAARVEARTVLYDPRELKAPKAWPFRPLSFFVCPSKAVAELAWQPQHGIAEDLGEWYRQYLALGLDRRVMSGEELAADKEIVAAVAPEMLGAYAAVA